MKSRYTVWIEIDADTLVEAELRTITRSQTGEEKSREPSASEFHQACTELAARNYHTTRPF